MPVYSLYYSIPYLLLLLFFLFLYANEIGKLTFFSKQTSSKVAFVALLLFIGLRGHLFTDFISYYPFYEDLSPIYNLQLSTFWDNLFEPGFVLYSSFLKTFCLNYNAWVFVNTFVDLLVLYYFFKKYSLDSVVLCFIVFIAFQGISIEFNLYRNSKAIILFLLSIPYLQQRRFLPYLFLNVIGITFHSSAIFYLLGYFSLNCRIPKIAIWSTFFVVNILFLFNIHFTSLLTDYLSLWAQLDNINMKLGAYQDTGDGYGFSLGYWERMFTFLVFTYSYYKLVKSNDTNRIFYNCYFCYYVCFLLFADIAVLTERIPLLFIFSYWVLYPNVLFVQRGHVRSVILIALLLLLIIKMSAFNTVFCKYDNLLWGIESYEERYYILRKEYFD